MTRGDVVIVDFSQYDPRDKVRPGVVVQNDRDNRRMRKTIVAIVTGNLRRVSEDTQYLIDGAHPDFPTSGLLGDSAINCSDLYTIRHANASRTIGSLSPATLQAIDECLKAALGIP